MAYFYISMFSVHMKADFITKTKRCLMVMFSVHMKADFMTKTKRCLIVLFSLNKVENTICKNSSASVLFLYYYVVGMYVK